MFSLPINFQATTVRQTLWQTEDSQRQDREEDIAFIIHA